MGAKEDLLQDLARGDASGGVERIHTALIASGLKYKEPRNSRTLFYYFRNGGREIGVAAMCGSRALLSFPAAFWSGRSGLSTALSRRPSLHIWNMLVYCYLSSAHRKNYWEKRMNDEILVEVSAIKEALAGQSGFDIRRIAEEIRKSEAQSEAEGWKHIPVPLQPLPSSTFQRTRFAHR